MKSKLFFLILLISTKLFAQSGLNLVTIGDFKTIGGAIIKDCEIGYRTIGKLNIDKTNAILWPTWYTGTSQALLNVIPKLIDTTRFSVIIVDALGNGVSSSPSNTNEFPVITIRDMVNSQYILLTGNFKINHVYAVAGISMGAMQTLEWLVAYPIFMDKGISIVGTPKQSFHDLLLWNTELEMIKLAEKSGNRDEMELAKKRVADIQLMELYTPNYFLRTQSADSLNTFLARMYEEGKFNISNLRSQLQAMMQHDIYKSSGKKSKEIKDLIKAKLLLIVSIQDHMVNPQSSMELSKQISCELAPFDNDCGHNLLDCGTEKVNEVINVFLK